MFTITMISVLQNIATRTPRSVVVLELECRRKIGRVPSDLPVGGERW